MAQRTAGGRERRRAGVSAALVAVPVAVLAGLGVFALQGGFADPPPATGPVTVAAAPTLAADDVLVCRTLLARVPDRLDRGLDQRPVSTDPERAAAWGDPAVVLRCGVGRPAALTPTAQVLEVNGVAWVSDEHKDGSVTWTTADRAVYIEVTVPDERAEASAQSVLNPLAEPVRTVVPAAG